MPSCLILYLNVCRARRASHLLELAASLVTAGLKQKTWSGKVASDETIQTMLYIKNMNIVQKVENNNTNSKCKSK